jgi:hypothetical protein
MAAMKKSRPLLTAACFLLFVLAFASANVRPAAVYCDGGLLAEVKSVQRVVYDVRQAWQELTCRRECN